MVLIKVRFSYFTNHKHAQDKLNDIKESVDNLKEVLVHFRVTHQLIVLVVFVAAFLRESEQI